MIILLRKTTPAGTHHYYTIHDRQTGLFDLYTLTTLWGPSPDGGREKIYSFSAKEEMERKLRDLVRRRIRSGYTVLYSYSREERYRQVLRQYDVGASGRSRRAR